MVILSQVGRWAVENSTGKTCLSSCTRQENPVLRMKTEDMPPGYRRCIRYVFTKINRRSCHSSKLSHVLNMCDGHFVGNTNFQLTVPAWSKIIPCWTTQVEYNVPYLKGTKVKVCFFSMACCITGTPCSHKTHCRGTVNQIFKKLS